MKFIVIAFAVLASAYADVSELGYGYSAPEQVVQPEPERNYLPPVVHQAPAPVVQVQSAPAPVAHVHVEAPAPVVHQAPAPVFQQAPAPVFQQAPAPVFHQAPAPVVHQAPAPVVHQAPAPVAQPINSYIPPAPVAQAPAPVQHVHVSAPVVHHAPAPVVHHAPAPVVHHAPAPVVHQAPAPVVQPINSYIPPAQVAAPVQHIHIDAPSAVEPQPVLEEIEPISADGYHYKRVVRRRTFRRRY